MSDAVLVLISERDRLQARVAELEAALQRAICTLEFANTPAEEAMVWISDLITQFRTSTTGSSGWLEAHDAEKDNHITRLAAGLDLLQGAAKDVLIWFDQAGSILSTQHQRLFLHLRQSVGDTPEQALAAHDSAKDKHIAELELAFAISQQVSGVQLRDVRKIKNALEEAHDRETRAKALSDAAEMCRDRSKREEYGHAKAACMLDAEMLDAEAERERSGGNHAV